MFATAFMFLSFLEIRLGFYKHVRNSSLNLADHSFHVEHVLLCNTELSRALLVRPDCCLKAFVNMEEGLVGVPGARPGHQVLYFHSGVEISSYTKCAKVCAILFNS